MRRLCFLVLIACLLCLCLSACSTTGKARVVSPATPEGSASPHVLATHDASSIGGAYQFKGELRCSGTQLVRYQPGLTNQGRAVTINASATYGSCAGAIDPSDPLSGGISSYHITDTDRSCHGGHAPATIVETYQWISAQGKVLSSQVKFTRTTLQVEPGAVHVTSTGVVQAGVGAGDQVQRTLVLADQDPAACQSAAGLQSTAGSVTLVFSKPATA